MRDAALRCSPQRRARLLDARLAKRGEAGMLREFGDEHHRYIDVVPAFVPRLARPSSTGGAQM